MFIVHRNKQSYIKSYIFNKNFQTLGALQFWFSLVIISFPSSG